MTLEDDIAALKRTEFFSPFDDDALRLVAFGSKRLSFGSGTRIYEEGEPANCGYAILTGEVNLQTCSHNTAPKNQTIGVGGLLGELSLLTGNRRAATAIATQNVELLRIQRDTVTRVLEEYPHIAALIHDRLADSVAKIGHELETVKRRMPAD
ncbi:MAG: Crp/Fnr family transcriptional regulator [Pseudomonadota bacterium]